MKTFLRFLVVPISGTSGEGHPVQKMCQAENAWTRLQDRANSEQKRLFITIVYLAPLDCSRNVASAVMIESVNDVYSVRLGRWFTYLIFLSI